MDQFAAKLLKRPNLKRQMEEVYRFDKVRLSLNDYSEVMQNLGSYLMLGIAAILWIFPYHTIAGAIYKWLYPQIEDTSVFLPVILFWLEVLSVNLMLNNQFQAVEGKKTVSILSKLLDTPVDAVTFLYTRFKRMTIFTGKITAIFTIEQALVTILGYKGRYLINILMPSIYSLVLLLFMLLSVFIPQYISYKKSA